MRTKWLRLLAVLLAFTFLASACGSDDDDSGGDGGETDSAEGEESGLHDQFPDFEEPVKGGRLVMAMNDPIDCFSGLSYYGVSWSLYYFMARGLYGYPNTIEAPEDDTIEAHLAEDLPEVSDDGLTYTVKLREGLTFPDGSPVTSADVKGTYEYMLDPNIQCATGGPPASGYYDVIEGVGEYSEAKTADPAADVGISGITTPDELTTVFTLSEPDGAFVRALAMGWSFIVPAATPHEITDTPPPFVGPYTVSDFELDTSLTIDREPSWADNVAAGVPEEDFENNIDGIDLSIGVPDDIQLTQLKENEIDITLDGSAPLGSDIPDVANDPAFQERFFSTADSAVDYGIYKTNAAPFDDVVLRQAVNYAVDRDALIRIYGGELSRSAYTELLSENLMEGVDPSYTFDPDKAKELIEESGVETPIKVTLAHQQDQPGPDLAASIKESLDAVGFEVTLKGLSADVYYGYLADPASEWELAYANWGQDYNDAITYFRPLLTCPDGTPTGSNYGAFCDEEFDASVNEIAQEPTGEERTQNWTDLAVKTAKEKSPWWTLTNRRKVSFVSERVGNYIWGTGKQFYFANYFIRE